MPECRGSLSLRLRVWTIPLASYHKWWSIPRAVSPGIISTRHCQGLARCQRCRAKDNHPIASDESLAAMVSQSLAGRPVEDRCSTMLESLAIGRYPFVGSAVAESKIASLATTARLIAPVSRGRSALGRSDNHEETEPARHRAVSNSRDRFCAVAHGSASREAEQIGSAPIQDLFDYVHG